MARMAFLDDSEDVSEVVREQRVYPRPSLVKKIETTLDSNRLEGSVRKLKQDRGFGFIAGDDGRDHFFHWSGMEKTSKNFRELEIQDRVSFVVVEGEKGPRAVCVRVISND